MTVSTTSISKSTNGNGTATSFPYDYKILEATDLKVIIRSATGAETVKATSTYAVTGVGADSGTIVFNNSNIPVSGEIVVVTRNVLQTQAIDYIANDPFPAETHEEGLDRATMVIQQVSGDAERSIKFSKTNTFSSSEFTVGATDRANKLLAFDSTGELAVTQELGTFKGNSATTTTAAYAVRDIVKATTTAQLNNIYICIKTSPIGTALTNTTFWILIVDAVSAAASAAAAVVAKDASVAAKDLSVTAKNESVTAKNESVAAKDLSVTAKNAAEAAFDSFDDRYLGAKSSNPSTDNDGNALITGALYFNSSTSQILNWTASDAWEAIKPTSTEQGKINLLGVSAVIADMAILGTNAIVADMAILATNDVVADMNVLGTSDVVTDMNVLGTADVVSDMNVLGNSATVTAMNLLGTSAVVTDMGILGTTAVVEDMGILATSAIVADMALLGTSANVSAMDLIGTSTVIANIATVAANVAGVNSFAARYRVGSSDPTSDLDEGDLFYNTNSNVVKFYNGSAWVAISADTDALVKVSSNDTTAGFLNGKLVAGTAITFTENNNGGNETLTINATDPTALAIALG